MKQQSLRKLFVYGGILAVVPTLVIIYAGLLIYLTWPISELSISKSGVFGDSFGALTSLFSGLAFSGMIVTILLQRDELELQRKEIALNREQFERSASAQERSARLSALSTLLAEYKDQLDRNDALLGSEMFQLTGPVERVKAENQDLLGRKNEMIVELEILLKSQAEAIAT
jgi:hypothetical protein